MTAPLSLPTRPRILVVSLRRIGDVLLTTPLIRSLRRAFADAQIDVLVFSGTNGILAGNPDINEVIAIPERPGALASLRLLARLFKRYDLAVTTQTGDRPTFYAAMAGRKTAGLAPDNPRLGSAWKRWLLGRSIPADSAMHRVEQMLVLARSLGIDAVPQVVCPAGAAPAGIDTGANYAVIHAAPMFAYKEWSRDGWRALAAGLTQRGLTIVAIGGPGAAEKAYLDDVWQGIAPVHQVRWPPTVALLKDASVYVGPDTSVTHLAAAADCPTVALFGPMDPRVWGPWPASGLDRPWEASGSIQQRGNVWIVQNPLPCLPCLMEGCERHINSRSVCLDELRAEQVLAAVDRALTA